ncbi:hypothetical protein LTR62_004452 [Meristemomyces frigidus]|uniref:Uncharacterized protein n=1 Tax=Meristemomyces frigidus TaxID=1508187 RepID=A0AAN7TQR3_9PEZI|nr:hypothetical protein LTR62_004452 [Meristemomyces frigidus]
MADKSTNVNGDKLAFFKSGAGFYKDGYCRTGPEDSRHLSIAAIMSHAFHQSEFGDNHYQGIKAGDRTCLSAHDFKACIQEMGPDFGPKVFLSATDKKALEIVSLKDLKKYTHPKEREAATGFPD